MDRVTILESDRRVTWHSQPKPLAWREHLLGLETQRTTGPGAVEVVVDDMKVAIRRWDDVTVTKTRYRLRRLATEVEGLENREFGRTPHRVMLWESSADLVPFRCLLPDDLGGGVLDRMWALTDDVLVAAGLRATEELARDDSQRLLSRAVSAAREWVAS